MRRSARSAGSRDFCYPVFIPDQPSPIGTEMEDLLDQIVFGNPDPAIQKIRQEWEAEKRETEELFLRVCQEQYELRLDYHRTCQAPNPEARARHDADLIAGSLAEEKEARLTAIWATILQRVEAVLGAGF